MPSVPKPKVVNDPAYLKWVRQRHCWFPMVYGHRCTDTIGSGLSEASHLDGKSRDDRVLPMCGLLHRTGKFSWHAGQRTFCRRLGTTKAQLIAEAEHLYTQYLEGK